jgi:phosphatidylglycerophosphate synthase
MDKKLAQERAASASGFVTRRLSDSTLVNIATHKYKGGTYTPIDNWLNPFWLFCANLLPGWIAPNMVTLIGVGFNILSCYLITRETNGRFQGNVRPWVNVVCGLCLFIYQTLDAMDGKHARATKNSTPLGQLFDHGLDALSCPMMILTLMSCIQIGPNIIVVCAILGAQVPFFLAQWAESKTGAMQHSLGGLFGVTETQLLFVCLHFLSACVPSTFWTQTVGDLGVVGYPDVAVQSNTLLVFGLLVPGGLLMILHQLFTTPADMYSYLQLCGALVPPVAIAFILHTPSGSAMLEQYTQLIVWTLAITLTYMTTQIIVMNMGHGNFAAVQPTTLLQMTSLLVTQASTQDVDVVVMVGGMELYLQLVFGLITVLYGCWSMGAISEICHVLDIFCLTINVPKGLKESSKNK